jgi:hypothetical protein
MISEAEYHKRRSLTDKMESDSEYTSDDCMCAGPCLECCTEEGRRRTMLASKASQEVRRVNEALARDHNEKQETLKQQALQRAREQEAVNLERSALLRLPQELTDAIMSYLTTLDKIVLSWVNRTLRRPLCEILAHALDLSFDDWTALKVALEADRWDRLVKQEQAGLLLNGIMVCGACEDTHPRAAFSESMLLKAPKDRVCNGRLGIYRICEHQYIEFRHGAFFSSDARIHRSTFGRRKVCNKHKRQQIELVCNTIRSRLGRGYGWNLGEPTVETTTYQIHKILPCLPSGAKDQEHRLLEILLRHDTSSICRHLRFCDVMRYYDPKDCKLDKHMSLQTHSCEKPDCDASFRFVTNSVGRNDILCLTTEHTIGRDNDVDDPSWLAAVQD